MSVPMASSGSPASATILASRFADSRRPHSNTSATIWFLDWKW